MKYFGVNKRVKVDSKYYEGPTKKREFERVIEYKFASKRLTGDPREIDYAIKIVREMFKSNPEVEVYSKLNHFDYEIIVKGKKKHIKEVFENYLVTYYEPNTNSSK